MKILTDYKEEDNMQTLEFKAGETVPQWLISRVDTLPTKAASSLNLNLKRYLDQYKESLGRRTSLNFRLTMEV